MDLARITPSNFWAVAGPVLALLFGRSGCDLEDRDLNNPPSRVESLHLIPSSLTAISVLLFCSGAVSAAPLVDTVDRQGELGIEPRWEFEYGASWVELEPLGYKRPFMVARVPMRGFDSF